jgi:electron transfer flavoprotein alpha subunit
MAVKILLIAETVKNSLDNANLELVEAAKKLMKTVSGKVLMVVPGQKVESICRQVAKSRGIDVIALENDHFLYPNQNLLSKGLRDIIDAHNPSYICILHNVRGCQTASNIAVAEKSQCISGVESITFRDDTPVFGSAIFNGKILMNVTQQSAKTILTIMPGAFFREKETKISKKAGTVETIRLTDNQSAFKLLGIKKTFEDNNVLDDADVIVSAGRGIGKRENFDLIKALSSIFKNAAVGASRTLCDIGWLSYAYQVGETGKRVSPRLYMACGISGARQHIIGMKNSQLVVAVNTDPQAAIFSVADYGVVEDLEGFLPVLVKKYEELKRINK